MTKTTHCYILLLFLVLIGCTAPEDADVEPEQVVSQTGRVVFTVTDAARLEGVSSVNLIVTGLSVHGEQGWTVVSNAPRAFELLELKTENKLAILADAELNPGTYDQVRLEVSGVTVTDSSGTQEATLPSGELKILGELTVKANSTSSVTFDFLVDESLHVTGNGKYIMAPVVEMETREDAAVEINSENDVKIEGGIVREKIQVGMDIDGNVKNNFRLNETLVITDGKIGVYVAPVKTGGRVVIAITDAKPDMAEIKSLSVTIDAIQVQGNGWINVSTEPKTYDLIALQGRQELVADIQLEPGTYEQLRLQISGIVVTDQAGANEAKLPSNELKFAGRLVVRENSTATALLDFLANESLHITGNGEYIFAPVVKIETREDAEVEMSDDVRIAGGKVRTSVTVGMDGKGAVGPGLKIKNTDTVSIEGGRIKIQPKIISGY